MRKILVAVVACLCLWSSQVAAQSTIHFGNGQAIASLAGALAVAIDGDAIVSHGPWTETGQTINWTLNSVTWTHAGGGTYLFDGGVATTANWLTLTGNSNVLVLDGQVQATRYNAQVLTVAGTGNSVSGPYLYNCGKAATALYGYYVTGANTTIRQATFTNTIDTQAYIYGLWVSGSDFTVYDFTVSNVQPTTASSRVYGIYVNAALRPKFYRTQTLSNLGSPTTAYTRGVAFVYSGLAGQIGTIRRIIINGLQGVSGSAGVWAQSGTIKLQDFDIRNVIGGMGVTYGVQLTAGPGAADDPTGTYIRNGTIAGVGGDGIFVNLTYAAAAPVQNVIVRNCGGVGFTCHVGVPVVSANNVTFMNGGGYGPNWPTAASDWNGVDPMHVNPMGGDFRLQRLSPCVDAGVEVSGRTEDVEGGQVSGKAHDRGAYEYQQTGRRDVRRSLDTQPVTPTRSERNAR